MNEYIGATGNYPIYQYIDNTSNEIVLYINNTSNELSLEIYNTSNEISQRLNNNLLNKLITYEDINEDKNYVIKFHTDLSEGNESFYDIYIDQDKQLKVTYTTNFNDLSQMIFDALIQKDFGTIKLFQKLASYIVQGDAEVKVLNNPEYNFIDAINTIVNGTNPDLSLLQNTENEGVAIANFLQQNIDGTLSISFSSSKCIFQILYDISKLEFKIDILTKLLTSLAFLVGVDIATGNVVDVAQQFGVLVDELVEQTETNTQKSYVNTQNIGDYCGRGIEFATHTPDNKNKLHVKYDDTIELNSDNQLSVLSTYNNILQEINLTSSQISTTITNTTNEINSKLYWKHNEENDTLYYNDGLVLIASSTANTISWTSLLSHIFSWKGKLWNKQTEIHPATKNVNITLQKNFLGYPKGSTYLNNGGLAGGLPGFPTIIQMPETALSIYLNELNTAGWFYRYFFAKMNTDILADDFGFYEIYRVLSTETVIFFTSFFFGIQFKSNKFNNFVAHKGRPITIDGVIGSGVGGTNAVNFPCCRNAIFECWGENGKGLTLEICNNNTDMLIYAKLKDDMEDLGTEKGIGWHQIYLGSEFNPHISHIFVFKIIRDVLYHTTTIEVCIDGIKRPEWTMVISVPSNPVYTGVIETVFSHINLGRENNRVFDDFDETPIKYLEDYYYNNIVFSKIYDFPQPTYNEIDLYNYIKKQGEVVLRANGGFVCEFLSTAELNLVNSTSFAISKISLQDNRLMLDDTVINSVGQLKNDTGNKGLLYFPSTISVGSVIDIDNSTIVLDSATNKLKCTVVDTNTTYTAGTGLTLNGTQFNCTVVNTDTTYTANASGGLSLSGTDFSLNQTNITKLSYIDVNSSLTSLLALKEPTITTLPVSKGGTGVSTLGALSLVGTTSANTTALYTIDTSLSLDTTLKKLSLSSANQTKINYIDVTSSLTSLLALKEPSFTVLPLTKGGIGMSSLSANTLVGCGTTANTISALTLGTGLSISGTVLSASGSSKWTTVNTNDVYLTSQGNVSIGSTITPVCNLHLHKTTNQNIDIRLTDGTTGATASDGSLIRKDTSSQLYLWNYENADMIFGTNNIERMRIYKDGGINIPTGSYYKTNGATIQADWNQGTTTHQEYIKNKPTLFDGNYNSLSNRLTAGTNISISPLNVISSTAGASQWTTSSTTPQYLSAFSEKIKVYENKITISGSTNFYNDTTNMLLWCKFENNLTDSSGKYTGTPTGSGTLTYDSSIKKEGTYSITFNGSSYIQCNNPAGNPSYWVPSSMSVSFWIKGYSSHTAHQAILSARTASPSTSGWMIYILPTSGDISWWFGIGSGNWGVYTVPYSSISQYVGDWMHIVYTFSGTTTKLYINNNLISSKTDWSGINFACNNLRIGSGVNEDIAQFYLKNGTKLDEVRIYNRALTENEISNLYTLGQTTDNQVATLNDLATKQDTLTAGTGISISGNTISSTVNGFNISTSLIGRVVLNNGTDGGTTRGIMMWDIGDTNWGMYMSQSGSGRSFSGATACGGYGFTGHAIRIRSNSDITHGLIYENKNETCLFSVRGSDGLGYFAGECASTMFRCYESDNKQAYLTKNGFSCVGGNLHVYPDSSGNGADTFLKTIYIWTNLGTVANTNVWNWKIQSSSLITGSSPIAQGYDLLFRYGANADIKSKMSFNGNGTYTNFTGSHRNITDDKSLYNSNYSGYIVRSTGKYKNLNSKYKKDYIKGNIVIDDALPIVELCQKMNDKSVWGVISSFENSSNDLREYSQGHFVSCMQIENNDYRLIVNGCGEGSIWVSDYNGILENGDYITSSDIAGIGMKQEDDVLHTYTVGKITMDCDFNPKLIPIQVIKQEEYTIYNTSNYFTSNYEILTSNVVITSNEILIPDVKTSNMIDINGNLIYENKLDEEGNVVYDYEYDMKYICLDGTIVDKEYYENNSNVYRMAFVGCSYKTS